MPDGTPRDGGGGRNGHPLTRRQRAMVVWRLVRGCAITIWRSARKSSEWRDHDTIGVTVRVELKCEQCHGH